MNINKLFLILFVGLLTIALSSEVKAVEIQKACCYKSNIDAPQEALYYKKYMMQMQKKRAVIYNALDLTDEQIQVKENSVLKNESIYETKFNELIKESYVLRALIIADSDSSEINQQKKVVKKIKDEINNLYKEEDKIFRKTLTREQRSKYSMIKKLERKEYKVSKHQKDYYKSNPRMRRFGNSQVIQN